MRRRLLSGLGLVLVWLLLAVPTWAFLFRHSSAEVVVASHDAVVHPDFDGTVRLDLGPYLPDLRTTTGSRFGVRVELGKTTATTTPELAQRYAAIAAHPEAEQDRVRDVVTGLARDSAVQAAAIALVPIGVWLALGRRRRRELLRGDKRVLLAGLGATALVVVLVVQPWHGEGATVQGDQWIPVGEAVPELTVPPELAGWEVQGGLISKGSQRLLSSLFDTYERSKVFYHQVADRVGDVAAELRTPQDGETVAVLVSDRHDNIGMDAVVRAVADEAGATVVLDAGDDTSTGETWEAFSLDSLNTAFEDLDSRVAVAGNHDNGTFVSRYLAKLGWTHLSDGEAETPFAEVRVAGIDDPRSSGLGTWRDEKGLSFDEVRDRLADQVCQLDEDGERVATLLVHDATLGATALSRGCTDLVLAGHIHSQLGPTRVEGENGKAGYSYTNGTTGGAAYAIAIGSKLRRDAEFTFVTYSEGRPVGIQPVMVRTTGALDVGEYTPLDLG